MPTNLAQFNAALTASEKKITGDFKRFYKRVIVETFRRIVQRTPVDTGRAIANWQISLGAQAGASLLVVDDESGQATIDREISKLDDIPVFSLVHISNNLEYISYLEYDKRSPKHPEGMVEITLTEMAMWLSGL